MSNTRGTRSIEEWEEALLIYLKTRTPGSPQWCRARDMMEDLQKFKRQPESEARRAYNQAKATRDAFEQSFADDKKDRYQRATSHGVKDMGELVKGQDGIYRPRVHVGVDWGVEEP